MHKGNIYVKILSVIMKTKQLALVEYLNSLLSFLKIIL